MIDFAPSAPRHPSSAEPLDPWPRDPEARRARQQAVDALGEDIARLSAHLEAAAYRLLVMIREFDHWRGWHRDGAKSCAQWLAWRTGITPGAARERVRVARAVGIDAWTAAPDWDGGERDVDLALEALAPPLPAPTPYDQRRAINGDRSQRDSRVDASADASDLREGSEAPPP